MASRIHHPRQWFARHRQDHFPIPDLFFYFLASLIGGCGCHLFNWAHQHFHLRRRDSTDYRRIQRNLDGLCWCGHFRSRWGSQSFQSLVSGTSPKRFPSRRISCFEVYSTVSILESESKWRFFAIPHRLRMNNQVMAQEDEQFAVWSGLQMLPPVQRDLDWVMMNFSSLSVYLDPSSTRTGQCCWWLYWIFRGRCSLFWTRPSTRRLSPSRIYPRSCPHNYWGKYWSVQVSSDLHLPVLAPHQHVRGPDRALSPTIDSQFIYSATECIFECGEPGSCWGRRRGTVCRAFGCTVRRPGVFQSILALSVSPAQ